MTDKQWNTLQEVVNGKVPDTMPAGFIIDSPWLPGWYGIDILDYFSNDELWLRANLKALETFPELIFIPGFWSEFGMCSEPSAFGAISSFPRNEFPHAHKCIHSIEDMGRMKKPGVETDGLAPLILNRLVLNRQKIEEAGHKIRFSVSRGPLNIASYLMGTTEFMLALMTNPDECHTLLGIITDYLVEWHDLQKESIPTIEGMMVLDDIIGFIGEEEFRQFGLPNFTRLFRADNKIRLLHNDADCSSSLKYYPEMGVNIFNMGFEYDLNELKSKTGNSITMLGNIPPRDVLAAGSPEQVRAAVDSMISNLEDPSRIIVSCGGGMPPGVQTENISSFLEAVRYHRGLIPGA
jgi:uroporphyrinogen decarboxylase